MRTARSCAVRLSCGPSAYLSCIVMRSPIVQLRDIVIGLSSSEMSRNTGAVYTATLPIEPSPAGFSM